MTEQAAEQLSQIANIRQQFAERDFKFTDGKLRDKPRCFGIIAGCTLELIGEEAVEQATMVAILAPDAEGTARKNGFRMAALMALLAGDVGVRWIGDAMKRVGTMPGESPALADTLGPWAIRLVYNRAKSCATLRVRAG